VFSKDFYCRQVKTRAWFGKGLIGEGVLLNFNCKENRWFQSYFTKYVWTQSRPIRLSKRNSIFFRSAHGELLWSCCVRRLSCIVNFLPCVRSRGHIFQLDTCEMWSWNLVRMFVLIKSRMSLKLGHVGLKTRSLGQILEKPCVRSRCHIFSQILVKFGLNVSLHKISDEFENGSCGVKN
jgi:hypothetical protein